MIQFSSLSLGATYDFALATDVNDSVDFSLIDAGQLGQLQQSPGIDVIVLQGGNDTALDTDEGRYFFGNAGNDSIDLQGGNDFGSGGRDSDTLTGGNGDDSLFGNLGDDSLSGDAGNDRILGGQGEDKISGGAGNDYLGGDKGSDTLTGGDGADTFVLQAGFGIDTVTDFEVTRDKFILPAGVKFETLKFDEISASETEIFIVGATSPLVVVVGVGSQNFKEAFFIEPEVTPGNTMESSFDLGVVEGARQLDGFVGALDTYDFYKFSLKEYTILKLDDYDGSSLSLRVFGDLNRDGKNTITDYSKIFQSTYSQEEDHIQRLDWSTNYRDVGLPPGEYSILFSSEQHYEEIYSYNLMFEKTPINSKFDPSSSLKNAYDLGNINDSLKITEYVGKFDTDDMYKVIVSKQGILQVSLVDPGNTSYYRSQTIGSSIILDVDQDGSFDNKVDKDLGVSSAVSPGQYYIRVKSEGDAGEMYQLSLSLS